MSLKGKKWIVKNNSPESSTLEKIMELRSHVIENEIDTFHNPFLFTDMRKAVSRIKQAIKTNERIIIFGDYDVDGITGTAILFRILQNLGARVSCRIPHRENDGYGLSTKYIDECNEKKVSLFITVDNGISCNEQITYAKNMGIDVIITDHHTIPNEYPADAFAILHPKYERSNYPYKELTGAGVALKLAHALILEHFPLDKEKIVLNPLLDLASMGTIADLGPLDGENRLIVKKGLEAMAETKWVGLKKILELSGVDTSQKIDTSHVGFRIGPRINASGRIDSAYVALSLLLQDDDNEKLHELGQKLEELNQTRQSMTEKTIKELELNIANTEKEPFIYIDYSPDWHVGILGLAAGKIVEKYAKPAIMMQDFGDNLVGSARSPEYFNIVEALTEAKDLLSNFGGHASAAGFNIKKENLEEFKNFMIKFAEEKLKDQDFISILDIDSEIEKEELNLEFVEEFSKLEPFGIQNSKPIFLLKNIKPVLVDKVGKEGKHLRFILEFNGNEIDGIAFNMGDHLYEIRNAEKIDIVFELNKNIWKNSVKLQLNTIDIKI